MKLCVALRSTLGSLFLKLLRLFVFSNRSPTRLSLRVWVEILSASSAKPKTSAHTSYRWRSRPSGTSSRLAARRPFISLQSTRKLFHHLRCLLRWCSVAVTRRMTSACVTRSAFLSTTWSHAQRATNSSWIKTVRSVSLSRW